MFDFIRRIIRGIFGGFKDRDWTPNWPPKFWENIRDYGFRDAILRGEDHINAIDEAISAAETRINWRGRTIMQVDFSGLTRLEIDEIRDWAEENNIRLE
ncbi:MAG: hypothetical protein GPJ52_02790 [Candidatus Heimdallarchaeota archaeon]|nr:hypothetical protein [Candidatus Heimdallarchaeota archaeon]